MVMKILRQNRWVALLIGALFVSLSLISLLGMQAETTEGEEQQQDMPKFVMAALAPEGDPDTLAVKASTKQDREPVNILSSIVFHEWNKPGGKQDAFSSSKGIGLADPGNLYSQKTLKTADEKKEESKSQDADGKPAKQKGTHVVKSQAKSLTPPTTLFFTRTNTLTQAQKDKATWTYDLSAEELLLLQKIVMAEAEGEPYEGKVAVANVVLNRLRSANFPDTITDVIYQKHQFSPVANGRLKRVQPNEETIKSVNAALHGQKEVKDDTYFFLSLKLAQDLTVHHSRTFVKKIGNHSFYK
ncbi:N-acetylmuramoyl-L-alanine amidase [Paenibacillus sp. LBL]|uniref:cell wall hydrolase n=1 Tax=Paenibacillus sp. LBL TaxID=2940563 RepID=UPI00247675F1|nr:cell wall hydrolase [Paenibacillus sp. LBL]MDH6673526.1 N-acetylmuramoyl-L-alanine amidase [Paenibacillus sp. LBL]